MKRSILLTRYVFSGRDRKPLPNTDGTFSPTMGVKTPALDGRSQSVLQHIEAF